MNNVDELITMLLELEEVKNFKRLNEYIYNNQEILDKFNNFKKIQKQMVNTKHFGKDNAYNDYKESYEISKEEMLEDINVSQYLLFLDETNKIIKQITSIINHEINDKLQ